MEGGKGKAPGLPSVTGVNIYPGWCKVPVFLFSLGRQVLADFFCKMPLILIKIRSSDQFNLGRQLLADFFLQNAINADKNKVFRPI